MKKFGLRNLAIGILLAVLPLVALPAADEAYVILISIDGFSAYHLQNLDLLLPNVRELAREGAQAESSETVFPSVTHPAHTTLITGVPPRLHGVISNRMRNRDTGESFHPTNKMRREIIAVPTIFDAAKKKNLKTASFFWPETRGDLSIDYNIPETFPGEAEQAGMREVSPAFLGELRQAGIPIDLYFQWYTDLNLKGAADAILAQAAAHVVRKHRPQLLAIHLLVTDATQHAYGPAHYLSQAALTQADYCVGIMRQAVRDAGIQDRTTFIIAADHGFHTVVYEVNLYPLFKDSGLLDRITLHPDGWSLYVELQNNFDRNRDLPALQGVLERARKLEGVARVVGPEEFHKLGLPRYEENPHVPGQYLIIADIDTFLVSQESNSSTARVRKATPSHSHGYLPDHPHMYPALVLSGFQVRKGVHIGHTSNYVIAPTISHLLNLEMTGFSAGILREALESR